MDPEKTKSVARCTSCGNILPVQIDSDGTVRPFSMADCCEVANYEVLEDDSDKEFNTDDSDTVS